MVGVTASVRRTLMHGSKRKQKGVPAVSTKNIAVFGIYPTIGSVQDAVGILRMKGFRNTDISALVPENEGSKDLATEKSTKAPEGAVAGAGSGALVGGVLGWLVSIGALSIPGVGAFVAAGPIIATLAGIGAGAAVGGIAGSLVGLGLPEYEAKRYEGRIRKGGILLSVHCDNPNWTKSARKVLEQTGAEDISTTGEAKADFAQSDEPMPRTLTGGS
jgi:hypothetical protein